MVTRTATIAESASLSNAIQVDGAALVGLKFPAAFTGTKVTFEVSVDGLNFGALYDNGTEASKTIAAGIGEAMDPGDFLGWKYIKIRSGTSGTPVTQTAAREIIAILLEM